ncbi:CD109 antigen-like [Perognathus longimembris pacificus]|uniref:CD109 antigen-like n=1 Tax=Perognathus longimembris pacificus TaxID=214514 RepID=UPI002018E2F0|nr:CD109 antigen-like [Perognathus longimembris pacificus]
MALMAVDLLSGFTVPSDAIPLSDSVKKVEQEHGRLNLYLDSVNDTQFCVDIPSVRKFKVSNTQDASVSIVDYYEPRRQAVRSYNSKVKLDYCDICGDSEGCGHCVKTSSGPGHFPAFFLLSATLLCSLHHGL